MPFHTIGPDILVHFSIKFQSTFVVFLRNKNVTETLRKQEKMLTQKIIQRIM